MSKHLSAEEIIKESEQVRVKTFTDAYWELCKAHKLQIVQSPLSVVEYKFEEQKNEEPKVAS